MKTIRRVEVFWDLWEGLVKRSIQEFPGIQPLHLSVGKEAQILRCFFLGIGSRLDFFGIMKAFFSRDQHLLYNFCYCYHKGLGIHPLGK